MTDERETVPLNPVYGVLLDNEGIITTASQSNFLPADFIEVSEELFREAFGRTGRVKLVDGQLHDIPQSPSGPIIYRIAKTTPWIRMTDVEGDLVYAAMSETSSRLRAIYDAATFLSSGDPLWSTMHDILAATLSKDRANELLAPET